MKQYSEGLSGQTADSLTLGEDREYFIQTVLNRSLPRNIFVDRGVIVSTDENSRSVESNPQDIILYRSDFPVMSGLFGSRRFFSEGVVASIEIKSFLNENEFRRAIKTLNSACHTKVIHFTPPENLPEDRIIQCKKIAEEEAFTFHQVRGRSYLFAYRGVHLDTLLRYIANLFQEGYGFWNLPSVICVIDPGICLVKDDGQLLDSWPNEESAQCIYHSSEENGRELEAFMLHLLSSCLLSSGNLQISGTPFCINSNTFNFYTEKLRARPIMFSGLQDISNFKMSRGAEGELITTNDVLKRSGFC
ncbi:DUF6602 domain-containing protein [Pantanalinema rosaneae CENA516]|uniref:DUF6602 domain-containing protein n=1 Tax=Pantanalinema rosaneae TaxID=1620701 RepID=UPI003D6DFACE